MGEEGAVAVEGMLKAAREPAQRHGRDYCRHRPLTARRDRDRRRAVKRAGPYLASTCAAARVGHLAPVAYAPAIVRALLVLVLGLGFLLSVSLVVSAALAALGKRWGVWFEGWDVLLEIFNFVVSFGMFTLLFAMIYKIMLRAKIPWRDVWTGAAVTALLFAIGKVLIGLYLGKSSLPSGFGAAGSLVVLIAWVYYSAQIFLFGAEYTWVNANRHGSRAQQPVPGEAPAVPSRSGE